MYDRTWIVVGAVTVEWIDNRNLEREHASKPIQQYEVPPPTMLRRRVGQPSALTLPTESLQTTGSAARVRELGADIAAAFEFMAARFGPPALSTLTVSPVPGAFAHGFPGLLY